MKKSLFIVVDGIDGSGKTEIVKMLHNYLSSAYKKYRLLATREPTDGFYGKKIRQMLREEKEPKSSGKKMTELFLKDRQEHLKNEIEPFLKKSASIVLCDRYYYSTIAFQAAQGISINELIAKNKPFRKPEIAFILDVEPEIALERIVYRQKEKFEHLEFMRKIRANFLKMPKLIKDNIKIINASKPLKNVFEIVKKEVDKLI